MNQRTTERRVLPKRIVVWVLELFMPFMHWQTLRFEFILFRLRVANALSPRHQRRVRKLAREKDFRLNLGSGPHYLDGWVNVDGPTSNRVDLRLDLRGRIPLQTHQADFILCEHFLEHLPFPESAMSFLEECVRLLKADGILRISVPDTGRYVEAYCSGDQAFFERERPGCSTRMIALNHVFRQGGQHHFAYDFETLSALLREAGFRHVQRSDFNESQREWYQHDLPVRAGESLYVEASPGMA